MEKTVSCGNRLARKFYKHLQAASPGAAGGRTRPVIWASPTRAAWSAA